MATPSSLTEKAFADRRRAEWEELEALTALAERGLRKVSPSLVVQLPPLYRSVCADLAAAQTARYSAALVDYLLRLTAAAHGIVYGSHARARARARALGESRPRTRAGDKARRLELLQHAWFVAFPLAVRARWRAMLLATALFFLPFALGAGLTLHDPTFAFRVVPEATLRPLTEAYARGFDGGREAGEGIMMAGFYVYNNVGIALRCFALGIFAGIGTAFYLVHNGLSIGAVLGYVASHGAGTNIGVFILGHGSLELGAIVLAGGAGLSMGWSIVAPGDLRRVVSLQQRARELVVVAGASVMLAMAALVEAFWSASAVPREVKLGAGGTLFFLVLAYILFAGRQSEAEPEKRDAEPEKGALRP